jgi:hypothetical protein
MSKRSGAPGLEPARFPTNCRGCGTPMAPRKPALRRPRTGALTCATCTQAELRPLTDGREPPQAA